MLDKSVIRSIILITLAAFTFIAILAYLFTRYTNLPKTNPSPRPKPPFCQIHNQRAR